MNIFFGLLIVIIVLLLLDRAIERKFSEENVCYTFTENFKIYNDPDGHRTILYFYFVGGKQFESANLITREKEKLIGDKVKVQYICLKPKRSRLVLD